MRGVLKDAACTANLLFGRGGQKEREAESALNKQHSHARSYIHEESLLFLLRRIGGSRCGAGGRRQECYSCQKAKSIKRLCGSESVHIQKFSAHAHSSFNLFITLLRAAT